MSVGEKECFLVQQAGCSGCYLPETGIHSENIKMIKFGKVFASNAPEAISLI